MNKLISIALITVLTLCFIAYDTYFDNLNKTQDKYSKKVTKEKKRYDQPGEAAAWLHDLRQTKDKSVSPAQLNQRLKTSIQKREAQQIRAKSANAAEDIPKFKFENLGPSNFGGRIRGFVVHPQNPEWLLAGSVSGGIWKSIDGGNSWKPKADFLQPSLLEVCWLTLITTIEFTWGQVKAFLILMQHVVLGYL